MNRQILKSQALRGILGMVTLLILAGVSLARNPELRQIREELGQFREKISPVLLDEVAFTKANPAYDREIPVIVKVNKDYFEDDLENRRQLGRSQRNMLKGARSYTGRLTTRQIEALLASGQVEYVTLDATIRLNGKPTKKGKKTQPSDDVDTGSDAAVDTNEPSSVEPVPVEPEPADPLSTDSSSKTTTSSSESWDSTFSDDWESMIPDDFFNPTLSATGSSSEEVLSVIGADQINLEDIPSGEGVGIAVFDSGLTHPDLILKDSHLTKALDFTSGYPIETGINWDQYGHGTAVAGLLGGSGEFSLPGIAPGVRLYDLKVVGNDGTGLTSHLIQAIDWLVDNAEREGIRVANLSLGHPPMESYQNDPLCQAVERLVKAGVVVVVSAGNLGKTADYPEIWGGITSPGNHPLVITVGAMNTHATLTHTDDTVASYSSRGPTYQDGLFKPDLVAPGNRILCLTSINSYLAQTYPELLTGYQYLELSGSSMATAVVSGVAALMLDANPDLNPNLVKLILLTSAIKMQHPSMLEQGNGMLNAKTAVELADAVDVSTCSVADTVSPFWTLSGEAGPEEVWAGGAFAFGNQIVYGDLVQADMAGFWGDGAFWTDSLFKQEGVFWTESIFKFDGVFWTDAAFWGDSLAWTEGVFWTDVPFSFEGVFWTDFFTEGVFWTESLVVGDGTETDIAAIEDN